MRGYGNIARRARDKADYRFEQITGNSPVLEAVPGLILEVGLSGDQSHVEETIRGARLALER